MSRTTLWMFIALGFLAAARYVCIGSIELSPDEAYYSMWSERLDWAYYSKGPGVALAIRAGTTLFGMTEFGVRLLSPLLALGTSLVLYAFTRRLYGEGKAVFAVALANVIPIFNVGSVVMTIDPLSIFFWVSAVAAFWMAIEKTPRFSVWWPATGLLIGLGFLCKYTNALLLFSVVLVLLVFPRQRVHFGRPGLYMLLLACLVCVLPPVIWNVKNEWVTAQHIWARGGLMKESVWNPMEILEFTGAHFGVYSPLIFVMLCWALVRGVVEWPVHNRSRFLMCFSLPIIVMYFALSFKEAGEANWTAPGFVTLGVYAAHVWFESAQRGWGRGFVIGAMGLGMTMSLLVVNTDLVRQAMAGLGVKAQWGYERDPSTRLRGWRTTAEGILALQRKRESRTHNPVFLIANKYGTAAAIGFYLPEKWVRGGGHPPVYTPETQGITNQFAFWPRYDEYVLTGSGLAREGDALFTEQRGVNLFEGRNALYITDDVAPDLSGPRGTEVRGGFEKTKWYGDLIVSRRGQRLRVIRVFLCKGYKGQDL